MEQDRRQESRIDVFLDLYKQLEDALEDKYRNARRHYSSVVFEFIKDTDSEPVRDKLEICREIRNLLTHSANLDGEPIVEPSAPVVAAMEEVLEFVRRPPLALEFATKGDQVMKAHMHQRVLRLMEVMDKNGYSHIPVMENGQFRGVFSVGTVFQYILQSGGKGIQADTTVAQLGKHLSHGKLRICSQERHLSFRPADLRAGAGKKQAGFRGVCHRARFPRRAAAGDAYPLGCAFLGGLSICRAGSGVIGEKKGWGSFMNHRSMQKGGIFPPFCTKGVVWGCACFLKQKRSFFNESKDSIRYDKVEKDSIKTGQSVQMQRRGFEYGKIENRFYRLRWNCQRQAFSRHGYPAGPH